MTYPSESKYLTKKEIHSHMREMSKAIDQIESNLNLTDKNEKKSLILSGLSKLDSHTSQLSKGGSSRVVHPLLGEHLDRFREEIRFAINGLQNTPANYYWTTRISSACTHCHQRK